MKRNNCNSQILVGDFNLNINNSAILKFDSVMCNLVKKGNFKTTRNSNYYNLELLPFADYIFVSKYISINNFDIFPDEISDHLALLLDL